MRPRSGSLKTEGFNEIKTNEAKTPPFGKHPVSRYNPHRTVRRAF
ncbi:hypothetical protein [Kingella oralis]